MSRKNSVETDNIYSQYCKKRLNDVKEIFFELSKAFGDIPEGVVGNSEYDDSQVSSLRWYRKISDIKTSVSLQMEGAGMLIDKVMKEMDNICIADKLTQKEVAAQMRTVKLLSDEVLEIDDDGYERIWMDLKTKNGRLISAKEAAGVLGKIYGIPMIVSKESRSMINGQWSKMTFRRESVFKTLIASANSRNPRERVSGDNYTDFETEIRGYMILSDGMGTGYAAGRESEGVVELTQKIIEAGLSKELAVSMVNSFLVAKSDESEFTTIDLCEINLFTGVVEFIKMGAAPSFIKRHSMVEIICPASLPAGVECNTDIQKITKKLYEEDFAIMVTDGVMDAFYEEDAKEILSDIILDYNGNNPTELANIILNEAINSAEEHKRDDMSVLVAGMWHR